MHQATCCLVLSGALIAPLFAFGASPLSEPPTSVLVAAANARSFEKARADFVCTGTNDERVLNAAIERLTYGGTLRLADGDYNIDAFECEGNSAVCFGYNGGDARTVTVTGTTENKGYNTRHGVSLHVTRKALAAMDPSKTYRVFYGTQKRPQAPGVFYRYTRVNNANFVNFHLYFADTSKTLIGIDGRGFGSMELDLVGIYADEYFTNRYTHAGHPRIPVAGTVGVWSVGGSNDESARSRYNEVNVGGLHRGFVVSGADHLVMTGLMAARCVYGYWFENGSPKTMTIINCGDEGCTYLPHFKNRGHLTMIDFNIERFNADYIPLDPDGEKAEHGAVEETPGAWKGFISYTLQGNAFGLGGGHFKAGRFWAPGSGGGFVTYCLDDMVRQKLPLAVPSAEVQ